jgi:hypothetical protein
MPCLTGVPFSHNWFILWRCNTEGLNPVVDHPAILTMNSAITLMTSHNTEGLNPVVDHPAILTMNSAITLMTSHNTEGLNRVVDHPAILTLNSAITPMPPHNPEGLSGPPAPLSCAATAPPQLLRGARVGTDHLLLERRATLPAAAVVVQP